MSPFQLDLLLSALRQGSQNGVHKPGSGPLPGSLDQIHALRNGCPIRDPVQIAHLIATHAQSDSNLSIQSSDRPPSHIRQHCVDCALPSQAPQGDLLSKRSVAFRHRGKQGVGVDRIGRKGILRLYAEESLEGAAARR